jgi:hypothetical protein
VTTTVGPYQFSTGDVAATLRSGPVLFDLLTEGLDPEDVAAVAPHRSRAEQVLHGHATGDVEADLGTFWGEWRSAMAAVREVGAFGASATGAVAGLFVSDGGVPKAAVPSVEVDHGGVVGDRQANRVHHGRPWQALCLWSTEVIDAFRADGHPLAPGLAGENVTISGLPWDRVRPGVQLRLGDVLAEVSAYAIPCKKNAAWFLDGRFDVMHHRHGPVSRAYATVLEPGAIATGDAVVLEPSR